ncbi:DUF2283 domain-containing protein [Rubrobacter aplysinae]|uniref:DUF2283 domain-containing protein n=1 Tax=Rubrobacter aplysinae TaxID=909625 RepID=UPI00064C2DDC|nr:DUF2283 domain-containing protein [Rubrobacter aplysinae]
MRFELDSEVNALYIYFREIPDGAVTRTVELEEGVNLDIDSGGQILGLEFVDADNLPKFLTQHGGELDIPERAEDLKGFSLV